ncbi:MAG: thiamine pyrophosphate-dependent enzyme, partial [Acidimicrobiia bacterium]
SFAEEANVPVLMNGLGRGTLPADHPLAFSRARASALREADLVLATGTPLDFRLAYGSFGDARVVHLCESSSQLAGHVDLAAGVVGDLRLVLEALASACGSVATERRSWVARLRGDEVLKRAAEAGGLASEASPIKPPRIYGELAKRLDRDAIVIGDGGDFVSYAGKYVDTFTPGCFLDPGPYGCLGTGPGYALAARLAHPSRQVVLLLGDGAAGFSLMDFDTLVRFRAPVVAVLGNNSAWGLEKHPMKAMYGYHVAAELAPETRYDQVVAALSGHGELVREPAELGPALDRAFASGVPSLVNVMTDPEDVYPRSSNLM